MDVDKEMVYYLQNISLSVSDLEYSQIVNIRLNIYSLHNKKLSLTCCHL